MAQIDLSTKAYSSEVVTEFSLEAPDYVDVFILIWDINTSYFDVSVMGLDGYNSTVLHGEGYSADQDGGLWEEHLRPGTYQIVLTSHQSRGHNLGVLENPVTLHSKRKTHENNVIHSYPVSNVIHQLLSLADARFPLDVDVP